MINQNLPYPCTNHERVQRSFRFRTPCLWQYFILLALLLGSSIPLLAQTVDKNFVDGQLLFSLKPEVYAFEEGLRKAEAILSQTEIPIKTLSQPFVISQRSAYWENFYLIEISDPEALDEYMKQLIALEEVAEAYKVPLVSTNQLASPNDPAFINNLQPHLNTVQASNAWALANSNSNVIVAVIDDAVDLSHPDLAANLWNSGDAPGGGDSDGNGFVDDTHGYDFADNDGDPSTPASASASFFRHGTHVAGIANGVTNNNIGISALAYNVQLMALKCASDQTNNPNSFSIISVINGINYAVDNDADIINMSLGMTTDFPPLEAAVDYAHSNNVIVVAAAGNNNTNAPSFPAAYTNSISVAASNNNDIKASFSNYGSWVDITAPGVGIYSTLPGNNYGSLDGTSMACPLVVSALALMKSHQPNVPNNFLINCLLDNADHIDGLNTSYAGDLGSGRLNVDLAIQCTNGLIANVMVDDVSPCIGQMVTFTATPNTGSNITYTWDFGDNSGISNLQNPTYTYNGSISTPTVTLTVSDGANTVIDQINLVVSQCQLQTPTQSNWFFYYHAGLSFNQGHPQADLSACQNGTFDSPGGSSGEPAAVMSDDQGNLLFYTDGIRVWNNNHQQINNTPLLGNESMSQGSLIVPSASNPDQYLIFHINGALRYSEVNIIGGTAVMGSLNNTISGNGLYSETNNSIRTGEEVIAIPNCDGYWIVTTAYTLNSPSNHLLVIDYSSNGFTLHSDYQIGSNGFNDFKFGYLKASPDGTRLAKAANDPPNRGIVLFDFNPVTGMITSDQRIESNFRWGLTFSPNSDILYATDWSGSVWQYDLNSSNNSVLDVAHSNGSFFGMQLGPDNKIYIAERFTSSISTIHFPDIIGNPGFVYQDVNLNPNGVGCLGGNVLSSGPGLPNMIDAQPTLVDQHTMGYTASNCYTYEFEGSTCSSSYAWDFGDPASGDNTSSVQTPTHVFSGTGTYTVTLTTGNQTITETITIADPSVTILGDATLCVEDGSVHSYFSDAGAGQYTYSWAITGGTVLSSTTDALIDVEWTSSIGQLSVQVTDIITGCASTQTLSMVSDCPTSCSNCTQTKDVVVNGDFEQGSIGVGTFFSQLANQQTCSIPGTFYIGSEAQAKCITLIDDLFDHTMGTRDGHYMIVDDHVTTPAYYVWAQQNINIVNGETYHFSFWNMRKLTAARPAWYQEFVLIVNGHILDTISTQGAPGNQWVEYCADWVADQTTSQAVIGIARINNLGNNLTYGMDDISFGTCVDCNVTANFTTGLHTIDDPWRSFFDQSTASGTVLSWHWDFGDPNSGANNMSTLQNPWHRFTGNGTYEVCLTATAIQGGKVCTSTFCKEITVYKEHEPMPCKLTSDFSANFKFRNDCSVTLTDQSTITSGSISQWDWNVYDQNGTLLFNSNQANVTFNRNFGSYVKICLEVTGNNGGCIAQICKEWNNLYACSITDPGGPMSNALDQQVTLFPNPAHDEVQIVLSFDATPEQLVLMDVSGKRVDVLIKRQTNKHLSIDLTNLPSGVYHLRIHGDSELVYKTIIKQ